MHARCHVLHLGGTRQTAGSVSHEDKPPSHAWSVPHCLVRSEAAIEANVLLRSEPSGHARVRHSRAGAAGRADGGVLSGARRGRAAGAGAEAGAPDEAARVQLRAVRPRPAPPARGAPLRLPAQPGRPPVRRLRLRQALRPPHRSGVHRVGHHLRGAAAGGAEAVALARVRGEGRAVDRRRRAGGAAELGDGEARQDVRQVLVHLAGGPRRPAAPRRAGAHGVAAGRRAWPRATGACARPRREVRGGQLGGRVEGGQGGDGRAGVDQPKRRLLADARQGVRRGRRGRGDEAPRALPVSRRPVFLL